MNPKRLVFTLTACGTFALRMEAPAAPVAVTDSYTVAEDATLTRAAAAGVLANDNPDGSAIEAALVTGPAHGTLALAPDGSFTYTPAADYAGADSFTYQARTLTGAVGFTIDSAQSRLQLKADLTTSAGNATDTDDSRLSGTMNVELLPATAAGPFTTARVVNVDARMIDKMTLSYGIGCLFPGFCVATVGVATRTTVPDFLTLTMRTPGPAGTVNAGVFSQPGNSVELLGVVDVTGSGLAADQVPTGAQTLNTLADLDLTNCQISSNGTTLTLKVPVTYTGRFFLDPADTSTNYVDSTLRSAFTGSSGFIIATAPATANVPQVSNTVTVNLTVTPVNDPPLAVADSYSVLQATTLTVPAAGVLANDTDIDSPASALNAVVLESPAHGTLSLAADGGFVYTPDRTYAGPDGFLYRAAGGGGPLTPVLVARGSVWKYLADGSDQGTVWSSPVFDDSTWLSGPAELGYGDAVDGRPEATDIRPDPGNQPIHATYYFRTTFPSALDPGLVSGLTVRLLRDDAAAVYLNGVEVYRDANLPAGALSGDFATAGTTSETDPVSFAIPANRLQPGENLLAVEVHQSSVTSSDVSFDFELSATVVPGARVALTVIDDDADDDGMSDAWEVANGFNPASAGDAGEDEDGDGQTNLAEFLARTDPRAASAVLRATAVTGGPDGGGVTFAGLDPALSYQLESSPDCLVWSAAGAPFQPASGEETRPTPAGPATTFYRLRVLTTWP